MIRLRRPSRRTPPGWAGWAHRIGGQTIVLSEPWPVLAPFRLGPAVAARHAGGGRASSVPDTTLPTFHADALLGGRPRRVECRAGPWGYRLRVEGAGSFEISANGGQARLVAPAAQAEPEAVLETVAGPVLVLLLALRGTWCLHASAVGTPVGVVGFLGPSGAGKSTLAAALGAPAGGWARVADDVLPITLAAQRAEAWPGFPQLKLGPAAQPAPTLPERLALRVLYVLGDIAPDVEAPAAGGPIRIGALSRREATLALVSRTVAVRLFDPTLAARHLAACARLSGLVPVRALRFPRTPDALPAIRAAIAADLVETH